MVVEKLRTFWALPSQLSNRDLAALAIFTFINTWTITLCNWYVDLSSKLDHFLRGCDHAGWNGHQLWLDHGWGSPSCSANRYGLPRVPKILYTRDYHGERSKDKSSAWTNDSCVQIGFLGYEKYRKDENMIFDDLKNITFYKRDPPQSGSGHWLSLCIGRILFELGKYSLLIRG